MSKLHPDLVEIMRDFGNLDLEDPEVRARVIAIIKEHARGFTFNLDDPYVRAELRSVCTMKDTFSSSTFTPEFIIHYWFLFPERLGF